MQVWLQNFIIIQYKIYYGKKHVHVPDEWKYIPLNDDEDNQAMIDAKNKIIPKLENNNPNY